MVTFNGVAKLFKFKCTQLNITSISLPEHKIESLEPKSAACKYQNLMA
jgi:hypothetical protein